MDTLPAELKRKICSLLYREDLISIRVVNKSWAYLAALQLFQELTITPLSLERLRLIAQHEVIATCIKSIIFRADFLPPIRPEMWILGEEHPLFQRYVRAYCKQERLRENNHKLSREIIDFSIPMLKRLEWLRLAIGKGERLFLSKDNSSHPNQQWYEMLYDLDLHVPDRPGAAQRDTEISKQFTHILSALANSGVHLQKLSITSISANVWLRGLQLLREPYRTGLTTLKTVFLESSGFFRHLHGTPDGHCGIKALAMLLEEAQSLQTLKLHEKENEQSRTQNDFLQCFRPSLPKLSRLSLHGITATEQNLIDTLLAYRATLARLDLTMVSMADSNTGQSTGSWYQFFRRVPESLPCLLDIRLRGLYYSVPMLGTRRRCYRGKLEAPYLKAVEHAVINAIDIPQPT